MLAVSLGRTLRMRSSHCALGNSTKCFQLLPAWPVIYSSHDARNPMERDFAQVENVMLALPELLGCADGDAHVGQELHQLAAASG